MHNESILYTIQHINWFRLIHNHHVRHYMWEVSKILVPALLTGLITIITMKIIDSKNKKRWLNDGHIKRKVELEIEIRKYLLGVKANTNNGYEELADWYENQDESDSLEIQSFNKSFESLCSYLSKEENDGHNYRKIFVLMDEYACYVPKINNIFEDFKRLHDKILELKTLTQNSNEAFEEAKKKPEHFDAMINTYLCFQVIIEKILKKLTIQKLK